MNTILNIAALTVKSSIRNKILYFFLFFSLVIIGLTTLMSYFSLGVQVKIMKDLSFVAMLFFGIFISLFTVVGEIPKDLQSKNIIPIFAKPIRRYEYIFGKYLGVAFILLMAMGLMIAELTIFVYFYQKNVDFQLISASLFLYEELLVITAFTMFFSTCLPNSINISLSLLVTLLGHVKLGYIRTIFDKIHGFSKLIMQVVYWIVPNLEAFNLKEATMNFDQVPISYYFNIFFYGITVILFFLTLSIFVFKKREF